jgi:phosphopantothenoylcysteine decarboxylase/phosphopantothenate--cysteine ligase
VELVTVHTAAEMRREVLDRLGPATIVIKAAAVADFHLSRVPPQKMKKTAARLSLELDPTPDILAELGGRKGDRLLIGFAAETENLVEEARRKLRVKNCDMVTSTGETVTVPRAPKREVAERIFDEVLKLRLALHAAQ